MQDRSLRLTATLMPRARLTQSDTHSVLPVSLKRGNSYGRAAAGSDAGKGIDKMIAEQNEIIAALASGDRRRAADAARAHILSFRRALLSA